MPEIPEFCNDVRPEAAAEGRYNAPFLRSSATMRWAGKPSSTSLRTSLPTEGEVSIDISAETFDAQQHPRSRHMTSGTSVPNLRTSP
jgi:hypothetical protein